MRINILILIGLLSAVILAAGCGGGSTAAVTTLPGIATSSMTYAEVVGKSFKIKTTNNTTLTYVFNNHSTATLDTIANGTQSGTWQVVDGNIEVTYGGTKQTLTRIQSETAAGYWLMYDKTPNAKTNFRFYNATSSSLPSYKPTLMGGAKQTRGSSPVFANVSTFSGKLTGAGGFANTSSSRVATYDQPLDITYDGTKYYVLDYNNGAVRVIDPSQQINGQSRVTTMPCVDTTTPTPLKVTFNAPQGITTDGTFLYVSETGSHVIRKINISTGVTEVLAGTFGSSGAIDANGANAKFNSPVGITTDGTNLYVADSGNHTIRKIQISTGSVTTLAGLAANLGATDGTYTAARFNSPLRLTTDGSKLYVTDFGNRAIRSVQIATGDVVTIAGNSGSRAAQVDGNGTNALFYHPYGITTDGANLYVTDFNEPILPGSQSTQTPYSNLIRKVVLTTPYAVSTVAGGNTFYPEVALVGDHLSARFARPRGIIWDGSKLLVANGSYTFDIVGRSFVNLQSMYNVIFSVSPAP